MRRVSELDGTNNTGWIRRDTNEGGGGGIKHEHDRIKDEVRENNESVIERGRMKNNCEE